MKHRKKSPKANLEAKVALFFEVGLLATLIIIYTVVEIKFYERTYDDLGSLDVEIEDEIVPITERDKPKPPPPPPPQVLEVINVVDDDIDLEEELDIESSETDEDEAIDLSDVIEEETSDEVFTFAVVEDKPIFPGCESESDKAAKELCFNRSILKHIRKNFQYPEVAKELGIQGRVFVSFVIGKSGAISDVNILRGVDKSLDKEASRIVKKLPKMTPAKQRGKPVKVSFMLPITFKLQ